MNSPAARPPSPRRWIVAGLIWGAVLGMPPFGATLVTICVWFWGWLWIPLLAIRGALKMHRGGSLGRSLAGALASLATFVPIFAVTFVWRTGEWESLEGGAIFGPLVMLAALPWLSRYIGVDGQLQSRTPPTQM